MWRSGPSDGGPTLAAMALGIVVFGAAFLAGLAVGFWRSMDEIRAIWRADRTFEPQMPVLERDALVSGWRRAVDRAKGWAS